MIKVRFKRAVTVAGYGSFSAGQEAELTKDEVSKLGAFIDILEKPVAKVDIVSDKSLKVKMSNRDEYKKEF